jgi:hypothetical protein
MALVKLFSRGFGKLTAVVGQSLDPSPQLFASPPDMSSKKQARAGQAAPITRARRQFDALTPSLHAASTMARAWRQADIEAKELARRELQPLSEAYDQRLKKLILMLDEKHGDPGLDETERAILSDFIADAALDLLERDEDATLDEIFDRHDDIGDADEGSEEEDAAFQSEFKKILGEVYDTEIDEDIDLRTPEGKDLVRFLIEEDEELQEARERRSEATLEKENAEGLRHEARLRQTVDDIMRELTGLPDTVSEMDADARRARAELIQRAESAAAEEDLLSLVAVRLELEQRGMAGHFSEKQLSACNKLLQEELRIFELENAWHQRELAQELPDTAPAVLTPEMLLRELNVTIGNARDMLARTERELSELQDLQSLKTWLRQIDESDEP